jgi:hypothetical protein
VRSFIICILIRVFKARRVRWVEHLAHMGEMRNAYRMLNGKPGRKDQNAS